MKIIFIFLYCLLGASLAQAQSSKAFFEEIINNTDSKVKIPIVLPIIEPQDVIWSKTVWRELILREKINLPLYYPTTPMDGRMSLIDVLMSALEKSLKVAYEEDALITPLTIEDINLKFGASTEIFMRRNNETGEMDSIPIVNEINTSEVKRFQIKELWFINKRNSRMEVRIIALCPIREYTKDDAEGILKRELFWVDYGDFRDLFSKQQVFNFQNDAVRLSLDDVFLKRYFSSRIIKEANSYDNRSIQSYSTGMDALLISDEIKKEIFDKEQDLWEY